MSYHELWAVLWNWKKTFTAREFSSLFASPDPNKVLHDMTVKGFLERTGWGRYRVASPEDYLTKKTNMAKAYGLLSQSGKRYALTGPDAVFFWTRGGYQVDRFIGFYPIHLKIEARDSRKWKSFLTSHRQRFIVAGEPIKRTLFGLFYVLYPEKDFKTEKIGEFSVTPLKETVRFCQDNVYSYEPALEMLDNAYGLGLKVRYMEAETNFS